VARASIFHILGVHAKVLSFILKYCAALPAMTAAIYAPFKPFVCAAGAHPNPFDEYYAPPFVTMCAVDVTRLLTRLPSVSSGVCAIFHFGWTDNSIAATKKWALSRESQMLRHCKVLLDRTRPLHISQIFLR